MIYKAGETITFVAYYTADGAAKTGITVSATVYKIGTGSVATPIVSEQGGGLYYCTFTPSEDGVYVCVFHTDDTTVDQSDIAGIAFRGVAGVNNLDAAVSSRSTLTQTDIISDGTPFPGAYIDTAISSRLAAADYTPAPSVSDIDNQLTASHGVGSWQTATIEPMIFQMAPDELEAMLDGQSRQDIEIYKGDYLTVDITVVDANNNPVDLTGASAVFTARTRENSTEYIIQKSLTITDPTAGKMRLELTSTETDQIPMRYPADIELTLSDGTVKTVWKAAINIKWDVSR